MLDVVEILLALAAAYCAVAWLGCLKIVVSETNTANAQDASRLSCWLGLCFVLALGFLGILLK